MLAVLGLVIVVGMHVAAYAFLRRFDPDAALARGAGAAIVASAFVLLLVLSSAFGLAAHALFTRGDLDLLLSSPVPVANVYAARGVVVGIGAVATVAVFLLPFANVAPLHGHWRALAAYPVLAAIGLACAALAFAATFALVRAFGLRRARVIAQVAGALAGGAMVLAMQAQAILPRSAREGFAAWMSSDAVAWWLSRDSPLLWPLRGLWGEALPALGTVAAAVALFALVIRATTPSFAAAATQPPVPAAGSRPRSAAARRFRSGVARIVIAKELTLIARDPLLIAQTLLQVVYMVPLFLILLRNSQPPALMAAALVMLAMSLAGSLAWMTVSGEESPDLLGSAPVSLERVRWLKAAAAVLPVAVLALPFLAWFAIELPRAALVLAPCLAAGLFSSAVVQVWTAKPNPRRDLRVRHKQGFLVNLAELLSATGWALVCYLAITRVGEWYWGAALALVSPAVAWISARGRARD
jgi:ABC-2 type transport system permease protein